MEKAYLSTTRGAILCLTLITSLTVTFAVALSYAWAAVPVINGDKVEDPKKWPWMAALVKANEPDVESFCGGTLIAPDRVLTAAHCVSSKGPKDLDVILGSVDPGRTAGEQRIDVAGISLHSKADWWAGAMTYDVAILKLSQSVQIQPLKLAFPGQEAGWAPGTLATVIGYGKSENPTESNPSPPENRVLREGTVKIISSRLCKAILSAVPNAIPDSDDEDFFDSRVMICTKSARQPRAPKEQSGCFGDSGGPVLVRDRNNNYMQVGIVSWGWNPDPWSSGGSCNVQLPRVSAYIPNLVPFIITPDQLLVDKPFSISPPRVTGETKVGSTLTCSPGRWGGDPANLSYEWYKRKVNEDSTVETSQIENVTSPSYRTKLADIGYTVSCSVTARNLGGYQDETAEFTSGKIAPPGHLNIR